MDGPTAPGFTLSRRHNKLAIDPGRSERRQSAQGLFSTKNKASFTPEQVAECRELFQIFDKNNDDKIDKSEFVPMMRALGLNLTSQELDMFFVRMDYNNDGSVQFHELVQFLEGISQPITLEQEMPCLVKLPTIFSSPPNVRAQLLSRH